MRKLILEILIIGVIINSGFFIYRRLIHKFKAPGPTSSQNVPKEQTVNDLKKYSPHRLPLCRPEGGNAAVQGDLVEFEAFAFVGELGEIRRTDLRCDDGRTVRSLEVLAKGSTVQSISKDFSAKLRAAGVERLASLKNRVDSANVYEWQKEGRPGRASLEEVSDGTLIRIEVFEKTGAQEEEKNNPTPASSSKPSG